MLPTYKKDMTIMLSCFALFIFISIFSVQNRLGFLDEPLMSWLHKERFTDSFVLFMQTVTKAGSGEIIVIAAVIILVMLGAKKMWGYMLLLGTSVFGGIFLNFLLKVVFQRQRPGEMSEIEVFGYSLKIASYSFPSGHTMRAVILFSFLILFSSHLIKNQYLKMVCVSAFSLSAFAVSLSRVVTGAHYPSDILAAGAVSVSWFFACLIALRYIAHRKPGLQLKK